MSSSPKEAQKGGEKSSVALADLNPEQGTVKPVNLLGLPASDSEENQLYLE